MAPRMKEGEVIASVRPEPSPESARAYMYPVQWQMDFVVAYNRRLWYVNAGNYL
jgi:hypothetical protein